MHDVFKKNISVYGYYMQFIDNYGSNLIHVL